MAEEKKVQTQQKKVIRTAKGKRREVKTVSRGKAFIHASINNTIVSVTDEHGNVIAWASAGGCGFRGPKKATPFAASQVIDKLAERLERFNMKEMTVFVTGIGGGRDASLRGLNAKGYSLLSIKDTTPVPHNGCRSRRQRRI